MAGEGTAGNRILIGLFALAVVSIAGAEIHKRYIPHRPLDEKDKERSPQKIIEEFQGGKDFNRASLDPEYVKKLSHDRGFDREEETAKDGKPKEDRVTKVKGKWWQVIKWLSAK